MADVLKATGLSVSYGSTVAVRDFGLELEVGGQLSLLGPNGAGKSTALMALTGLVKPKSGSITVEGTEAAGKDPRWFVERGIVLVPEGTRNFASMTVEENLRLPVQALSRRHSAESIAEVFELFPVLAERRRLKAGLLSGGEQKMLAIGRGLMAEPQALLIDEPTLGLAPVVINRIREAIQSLRQRGIAIVVAEQSLSFIEAIGGRVMIVERGSCTWTGSEVDVRSRLEHATAALIGHGTTKTAEAPISVVTTEGEGFH